MVAATMHFFVKIVSFEFLCFLEYEEDLYKDSHFYYTQYDESIYGPVFSFH